MGLTGDKAKEYWRNRSELQQDGTVGYMGSLEHYPQRLDFMRTRLPLDMFTLDYGCGTGQYAHLFKPSKYLGVDITLRLLYYTPKGYVTQLLEKPYLEGRIYKSELIFCATVLQHCDDDLCEKIIKGWFLQQPKVIALYEATDVTIRSSHCVGRSAARYLEMLGNPSHDIHFHEVHGTEHSLMICKL